MILESKELATHESVIERGLKTFVEVGTALAAIRDQRLYRERHDTFENYCQERWGWSRIRAHQMIAASEKVSALTLVNAPLPKNEAQARELSGLAHEQSAQVMSKAHERTGGNVTAAAIREARETVAPKPAPEPPTRTFTRPSLMDQADLDELNTTAPPPVAVPDEEVLLASPPAQSTVSDILGADPGVQDAKYMHEFYKALCRSDDFLAFDADKVGRLAAPEDFETLQHLSKSVSTFLQRMRDVSRPRLVRLESR